MRYRAAPVLNARHLTTSSSKRAGYTCMSMLDSKCFSPHKDSCKAHRVAGSHPFREPFSTNFSKAGTAGTHSISSMAEGAEC